VVLSATDKITFNNSTVATVQAGLQFGAGSGGGSGGTGTITGTAGADILNGTAGNDVIQGLAGNDQLIGGAGNDRLYGGPGDDWIRASSNDGSDHIYGDSGADFYELTVGDVIHYSSYQQSGAGFGIDTVATMQRSDPWTIDFTGFDANLNVAGQQKLVFIGTSNTPGTGQLAVITTSDFLHIPIGLGANLDSDPDLEFFVAYTWEFQATPTFII
jgi:Ca2+-binding RTX toxin-like protein